MSKKKLPWESFLGANNSLRKNVLFNSHPDLIFLGNFFFPGYLRGLKSVSGDMFGNTYLIGSVKKNVCISSKN